MTNKEKFVETFGESSYNNLVGVAKEANAIDIFTWLLDEYREPCKSVDENKCVAADNAIKIDVASMHPNSAIMDIISKEPKKRRYRGSIVGRGYDLKWYMDAVSDFYLGQAKSIEFKMSDDLSSGKKVKSLDGFKTRWQIAVNELDLAEEIWVHKYYTGTCNECVCLEKPNLKNSKAAGYSNMR